MNIIIQNILAFTSVAIALGYIVTKFIWSPKKKKSKTCGGDDGCGCH